MEEQHWVSIHPLEPQYPTLREGIVPSLTEGGNPCDVAEQAEW